MLEKLKLNGIIKYLVNGKEWRPVNKYGKWRHMPEEWDNLNIENNVYDPFNTNIEQKKYNLVNHFKQLTKNYTKSRKNLSNELTFSRFRALPELPEEIQNILDDRISLESLEKLKNFNFVKKGRLSNTKYLKNKFR